MRNEQQKRETQKEIEEELFEQLNYIQDKLSSLLNLLFVLAGFFLTIVSFLFNKNNSIYNSTNNSTINVAQNFVNEDMIIFSLAFMTLAFLIIIICMLAFNQYNKITKSHLCGTIGHLTGNELIKNNKKIYSDIQTLKNYYTTAIFSIACSVFSFYNYFLKIPLLDALLPILFLFILLLWLVLPFRLYFHFNLRSIFTIFGLIVAVFIGFFLV